MAVKKNTIARLLASDDADLSYTSGHFDFRRGGEQEFVVFATVKSFVERGVAGQREAAGCNGGGDEGNDGASRGASAASSDLL